MLLVFLYILLQLTLRIFNISLRVERNVLPHCNHLMIACPPSARYASRHSFCHAFSRCFVPTEPVPEAQGLPVPGMRGSVAARAGQGTILCHPAQLCRGHPCWGLLPLNQRGKLAQNTVKIKPQCEF